MTHEVDLLERRLLALGRAEVSLEQSIRELLLRARQSASEGRSDASDDAWNLHQEAKAMLAAMRNQIAAVEVRLYGLRRRMRK